MTYDGIHWTLWVLRALCFACVVLNLFQYLATRQVRVIGLLVCGAWALQETEWWLTGANTIMLALVCDAAIVLYATTRTMNWRDVAIVCIIPLTALIYIPRYMGHESIEGWWINWALVVAQFILGLPWIAAQRNKDWERTVTGRLKNAPAFAYSRVKGKGMGRD